jgi:anti-sigma factor RsiW
MECAKWLQDGLLYTSGELDESARSEFEKHIETCESCKNELETYQREKASLYTPQLLGEPTGARLDERMKEACAKIPRPSITAPLFMTYVKRGVLPVLFLLIGFTGGVYVAFNIEQSNTEAARIAQEKQAEKAGAAVVQHEENLSETRVVAQSASGDSAATDSAAKAAPSYDENRRGNIGAQGVVPVELQSK